MPAELRGVAEAGLAQRKQLAICNRAAVTIIADTDGPHIATVRPDTSQRPPLSNPMRAIQPSWPVAREGVSWISIPVSFRLVPMFFRCEPSGSGAYATKSTIAMAMIVIGSAFHHNDFG